MRINAIFTLAVGLAATALWSAAAAKEGRFNEVLSVGEKAPDFRELPGIDDKAHSLGDYQQAKAVVVVFTSNKCPVAIAYEDRLATLHKEFASRGVQLVAICPNFEAGHELEALKEHADDSHLDFPWLRDDDQSTARVYGATHTPHVFLLDAERNIAYMGAIDDNEDPQQVSHHYLRDAIEATLAASAHATKETQPFGCRIRYKRVRASRARN